MLLFLCLLPVWCAAESGAGLHDPLLVQWDETRANLVLHIYRHLSGDEISETEKNLTLEHIVRFGQSVRAFRNNPAFSFMASYDSSLSRIIEDLDAEIAQTYSSLLVAHNPDVILYEINAIQLSMTEYMYFRINFAEKVNRYYIFIIFLFVSVCILIIVLVAVFRRSVSRLERNEAYAAKFARSIINAQENERIAIARELHDTVAQDILYIKVATETMQHAVSRFDPGHVQSFDSLVEKETECINRIRGVCSELRPPELVHLGLTPAISELCSSFSDTTGIECRCSFDGVIRLGYEEEINCYRIIQESLNNIRKHSGATQVEVELNIQDCSFLRMRVIDNGIGISRKDTDLPARNTFGLRGMRERVRILNGTILIGQGEIGGTEICVSIPLTGSSGES